MHMLSTIPVLGPVVALSLVLWSPGSALAACVEPEPELVWSYPSDGAVDVPTDATFHFLSNVSISRVELDGRRLEAPYEHGNTLHPHVGYTPGALEPNTTHTLTVQLGADWETLRTVTISFQTGSGPYTGTPASVELLGLGATTEWDDFSDACQKVILAQDCYDTGQDIHMLVNVNAEALAYVVTRRHTPTNTIQMRSVFWPASCGTPSVFTVSFAQACYTVHALDATGRVASSREYCGNAESGEWAPELPDGEPVVDAGQGSPSDAEPVDAGTSHSDDAEDESADGGLARDIGRACGTQSASHSSGGCAIASGDTAWPKSLPIMWLMTWITLCVRRRLGSRDTGV